MNTINGSSSEPKDTEYDEFKQYETTKDIIDNRSDEPVITVEPPAQTEPKRVIDMTLEELQQAVINLMSVNQQQHAIIEEFKIRAEKVHTVWCDKKQLKTRLHQLNDAAIPKKKIWLPRSVMSNGDKPKIVEK